MTASLFIDLAIFALNIYIAVAQRGTIWGWIATAIVCWMVFVTVKMLKEI
jgi:hypothetical protein